MIIGTAVIWKKLWLNKFSSVLLVTTIFFSFFLIFPLDEFLRSDTSAFTIVFDNWNEFKLYCVVQHPLISLPSTLFQWCHLIWCYFISSHLFSFLFFSFHYTPLLSFPHYCHLPSLRKSSSPSTLLSFIILSFCIIFFSSLSQAAFLSYCYTIHYCTTLSLLFFFSLGHSISLYIYITISYKHSFWNIFLLLEYILSSGIYSFSSSEVSYRIIPYKIRKKCRTIFHGTICFHWRSIQL